MEQTRQFYQTLILYRQPTTDTLEVQDKEDTYFLKDNEIPKIDNEDRYIYFYCSS